ncbi:MAG: UDP-glucose/GDP-mannose dehydrogenase family protein, partial [Candidatus Sericytochromatia bacterium]|nr:UDP-glucose/GDP-mannose dehydrogenase family protein [Candidatus Sericytochromatia bacterium]
TGYVGLVTGTCFAEMGNDVTCIDINQEKIDDLKKGILPIYEPGLEEIVKRNIKEGRLNFTINLREALEQSLMVFIAVDTPMNEITGLPNLTNVKKVAQQIGQNINSYKVIVNKSTAPIGTAELVRNIILEEIKIRHDKKEIELIDFDMVSNPEFLKEGSAIEDFMKPDRVVIGVDNDKVADLMKELYSPFVRNEHPIIIMDIKSAEMTKYAANYFLSMKISFINEIANLCDIFGADVSDVKRGIASDSRIGSQFLFPGVGYGGSCFPKDTNAMISMAKQKNYQPLILQAIDQVNKNQRNIFANKIISYFSKTGLKDLKIAIWGLSYKPHTDDMRDAPSIDIIKILIEKGAKIQAYDPEAIDKAKNILGENNISYFNNMYDALEDVSAMILITEWTQFRRPDFDKMKNIMKNKLIFDGRNQYEPSNMKELGFEYFCIGRPNR